MARTKQTAKKSTGGNAPRVPLPAATTRTHSSAKPVAKVKGREPAYIFDQVSAKKNRKAEPEPTLADGSSWCAGCEDGGKVFTCTLCPRPICDNCVTFPPEAADEDISFYCPHCWHTSAAGIPPLDANGTRAGPDRPYQGLFRNKEPLPPLKYTAKQTLRSHWPAADTSNLRLVIISIRLASTSLEGDPASLVAHHVAPFYKNPRLRFEDIVYDFTNAKTVKAYDDRIETLAEHLQDPNCLPDKILVFITTHTTPIEGLIHTSNGGLSSEQADVVLDRLLPSSLQTVIRQAKTSMLFLLACGAVNTGTARDLVSNFVTGSGFQHAVGFTVDKFIPAEANTFIQEMVGTFFISSHAKKFIHLLTSHYDLGAHSDIVIYFPRRIYRYCWTHPTIRPYGNPLPLQCPGCLVLRPWILQEFTADAVSLECKNEKELEYPRGKLCLLPEGTKWSKDAGVQGRWYGQWVEGSTVQDSPPKYGHEQALNTLMKSMKRVRPDKKPSSMQ